MTDQEILEKAIQKAIGSGWNFSGNNTEAAIAVVYKDDYFGNDPCFEIDWKGSFGKERRSIEEIIFNHDFAKALWGKDLYVEFPNPPNFDSWQYHLREMVISDDPIKYLGEHM